MINVRRSEHLETVVAWSNVPAEVRLNSRWFVEPHNQASGKAFIENLNQNGLKVLNAFVEPSLAAAKADNKFQFERHGYFVADRADHAAGKMVFNLAVGLNDSWGK